MNLGNIADFVAGIGSLISGVRSIKTGLGAVSTGLGLVRDPDQGLLAPAADPTLKATFYKVNEDIEPRAKLIRDMALKGMRDPQVRMFTGKLLSTKVARCQQCSATNSLSKINFVMPGTVGGQEGELSFICGKCGKRSPLPDRTQWAVPEKDWRSEVELIYRAVRNNVRYTRDLTNIDTYQHPARTLESGSADCDDFTSLLCSMLLTVGYPVKLHVMETKDQQTGKRAGTWTHILMLVGLPPRAPKFWLPLDASLDKNPGWYPPKAMVYRTKDFPVTP